MTSVIEITKRSWILFACFTSYFALFLIPKAFPGLGATPFVLVLLVSILVVLPALIALAVWSAIGALLAWWRKRPLEDRYRRAGQIALIGFGAFIFFLILSWRLPSALPTGSHLSDFDQSVWMDPKSAQYAQNDITSRQKMLAAVIAKLPASSRAQIEQALGRSLEAGYFKSSGRDLIYILGPERDSFFGIDSEWLLIWFDKNGIFERYEVRTD